MRSSGDKQHNNHEKRREYDLADYSLDHYLLAAILASAEGLAIMNAPNPQFHTQFLGDERVFWACEELLYHASDDWPTVTVPANFVSDGFSIPKALRAFFSTAPKSLCAAVLHDWLYSKDTPKQGLTRRGVDKLFLVWLKAYGVGIVRRRLIYWGVRSGGWTAYNKNNAVFYTGEHK